MMGTKEPTKAEFEHGWWRKGPSSVRAGLSLVLVSAGAAFGAVGVLLVLDVLLDDFQGCATSGDDGIGR